jgi:hypothetical protein
LLPVNKPVWCEGEPRRAFRVKSGDDSTAPCRAT